MKSFSWNKTNCPLSGVGNDAKQILLLVLRTITVQQNTKKSGKESTQRVDPF
jgi:hypothetical protein